MNSYSNRIQQVPSELFIFIFMLIYEQEDVDALFQDSLLSSQKWTKQLSELSQVYYYDLILLLYFLCLT